MTVAVIILLSFFGCFSVIHLISTLLKDQRLRFITKPLCLLTLAIACTVAIPQYPLIYIGAYLSLAGDVFILFDKKKKSFFAIGMLAFFATHCCYMSQMVILFPYKIEAYVFPVLVVGLIILSIALYPIISIKVDKAISIPGTFYMLCLFSAFAFSIVLACSTPNAWPLILVAVGYGLFCISDTCLVLFKFVYKIKHQHFYVMLTYLSAEALIIIGFILLLS